MHVACAVLFITISLVSAVPSIRFSRSPQSNAITLTCRRGGEIQNAIFQRDGQPLSAVARPEYSFTITQNTEGYYTCHEEGDPTISSELQLAGVCNNLEVLSYYNASGVTKHLIFST